MRQINAAAAAYVINSPGGRSGKQHWSGSAMTEDFKGAAKRPVIAVVDDDPAVCGSLKFALELEGFAVRTYHSGAELIRADALEGFDCLSSIRGCRE